MMRPTQVYLAPEGAGGGSEAASGNAGPGAQQQQQQQSGGQQQQQQNEPPKFLSDIDDDLMDDDSRKVIENARTEMQDMHKRLQSVGEAEAKVKLLEQQLQQLQSGNGGGQQQQQQQNSEPTLNDRLYQNLINDGYKPEEAKHLAKTLGKTLDTYSEEVQGYVDAKTQPMVARLMQQQLQGSFQQLQSARAEAMAIPEVAQRVWERAENLQRQGMEVTYAVLENIMKQAHYDHITDPKNQQQQQTTQPVRQQQQQTTMPNGNGGTRFTYPGAGHIPVVTRSSSAASDVNNLDPETKAALEKVDGVWKNWAPPGQNKQAQKASVVRR